MKYVLITVVNREIAAQAFDTHEEARQKMEMEFNEAVADDEKVDDCEIDKDSAWANIDDNDFEYDWTIVAI